MGQGADNTGMQHQPVKSSNIKSVGYDAIARRLEVTFHNGTTCTYHGVPSHVHQALIRAKSVGSEFHKSIRGKYSVKGG